MRITCFFHPRSTYLPCTGIGRHINNMVLGLSQKKDIDLKLLVSKHYVDKVGQLDPRCPLRNLKITTFPMPENFTERMWKAFNYPKMDHWVEPADWLYSPAHTHIPLRRVPLAITIHDIQAFETQLPWSKTNQHRWFRYKWSQWVYKAIERSRIVFTASEFSKQRMIQLLGADPQKIVVVGNGVEQTFFDIATVDPTNLPRPVPEPYVLIVGGLRLKKGADYVLAVAKKLKENKSDLKIVVAGESEPLYKEAVKDIFNISLLGMVSDEKLPALVRAASSLLFLSLYEGFGIPAAEAMAAGTPVVVANCASLPEVVGSAGIVIEVNATAQIADTLIQLQADFKLREHYSQLGQERAKIFTWSRCVDRVQKALTEHH